MVLMNGPTYAYDHAPVPYTTPAFNPEALLLIPSLPSFDSLVESISKRKHDQLSPDEEHEKHTTPVSAKRFRPTLPTSLPAASDPQEAIKDLRAQIQELHDFVDASGLASGTSAS